jgi:lysozyme-like protein
MPVLTGPQVAAALKQAGFDGENLVIGIAVAKAESGWRTDATNRNTNGTIDRGLMQRP